MTKFSVVPAISFAALTIAMVACSVPGQQDANAKPSAGVVAVSPSPSQPVPGGFMNQPVDSPLIQEVAQKAITLLRERTKDDTLALKAVRTARSQVVAGAKYELTMDLTTKDGPKSVTVVVFESLQGDYSLTSVDGI